MNVTRLRQFSYTMAGYCLEPSRRLNLHLRPRRLAQW